MRQSVKLAGAALLGLAMCLPAQAQRPVWEQTGTLNCDVSAGFGFIVGSQRQVNCLFTPSYPAPPEQYVGTITKVGLDIGLTAAGSLVWAVLHVDHAPPRRAGRLLCGRVRRGHARSRASARTCWSAAMTARSRCSRSRCKARSASTSRPASPRSRCSSCADSIRATLESISISSRQAACRACAILAHAAFARPLASRAPGLKRCCHETNTPARDRPEPAGGRRTWQTTAARVQRVPGASHWWAHSRAARPRCLRRSWRAPARSRARARSRPARRSATRSAEARHHKMSVELSVATTNFLGDTYTFIDCPGSVEFVHDMRAALPGGRCRGGGVRGGREEDPAAAVDPARARRAEDSALPVPQQDRQGRQARARDPEAAAARFARAAGAAPDSDLVERDRHRLRRPRARARPYLQGACALRGRAAGRRECRPQQGSALHHAGVARRS